MSKRQIITLVILAILVALLIFVMSLVFSNKNQVDENNNQVVVNNTKDNQGEEGIVPEFSKEVDEKEEETEAEVVVINENNKNEKLGVYTITASKSGYSPDKITITENTIVTLNLKSEGGKFDLFIPSLSNHVVTDGGETNDISFRVSDTGTYRFECRDFCPSEGKIFGQLIVKPK